MESAFEILGVLNLIFFPAFSCKFGLNEVEGFESIFYYSFKVSIIFLGYFPFDLSLSLSLDILIILLGPFEGGFRWVAASSPVFYSTEGYYCLSNLIYLFLNLPVKGDGLIMKLL